MGFFVHQKVVRGTVLCDLEKVVVIVNPYRDAVRFVPLYGFQVFGTERAVDHGHVHAHDFVEFWKAVPHHQFNVPAAVVF